MQFSLLKKEMMGRQDLSQLNVPPELSSPTVPKELIQMSQNCLLHLLAILMVVWLL